MKTETISDVIQLIKDGNDTHDVIDEYEKYILSQAYNEKYSYAFACGWMKVDVIYLLNKLLNK